jgi:transcriptional regulator with XRE-family HTH domain
MTGQELKALRLTRGLKQRELADLLGYSTSHVAQLEQGKRAIPESFVKHVRLALTERRKRHKDLSIPLDYPF